jgi:hypothetical protein
VDDEHEHPHEDRRVVGNHATSNARAHALKVVAESSPRFAEGAIPVARDDCKGLTRAAPCQIMAEVSPTSGRARSRGTGRMASASRFSEPARSQLRSAMRSSPGGVDPPSRTAKRE